MKTKVMEKYGIVIEREEIDCLAFVVHDHTDKILLVRLLFSGYNYIA
jgi:hypothetical protein